MLNFDELPVGATFYSVSEEQWFAAGTDDDGEVYGDRDFRQIAECTTLEGAQQAAIEATGVRGRIYIDEMTKGENGSGGGPVFVGYRSELQAGLRIPVQIAVSSVARARQAG